MSAAETYNVPLSEMTVEDLECLAASIRQNLDEREEEAAECRIKKLKESGRLKELKEELKAVKKDAKAMAAKQTFEVSIPITFTVQAELYDEFFEDMSQYGDVYWSDMMHYTVKGKVCNSVGKEAAKVLQQTLDDILQDACEDFMLLFPPLLEQRDALEKRASKLVKELDKHELTTGDL